MNYNLRHYSSLSEEDSSASESNPLSTDSESSQAMDPQEQRRRRELKKELALPRDIRDSAKALRCKMLERLKQDEFLDSFFKNSNKEKLILEYVKKYNKMFQNIYGQRQLLLFPRNEFGCEKFICSTLRPTKLGFVKLFDYKTCAEFVSNFLQFEALQDCLNFPRIVPSPFNVLKWQKGDSLDISLVLASLLLGAGFDAYVVVGTAQKFITEKRVVVTRSPCWTAPTWTSRPTCGVTPGRPSTVANCSCTTARS